MRRIVLLVSFLLAGLAWGQDVPLLIRGGEDADVYLGCLTCSRFDAESVTNRHGTYGSETGYASIHNDHGRFGSRYADTSVCNPYAQHPPLVVSERGTVIGYLTLNEYKQDAIREDDVLAWLRNDVCR